MSDELARLQQELRIFARERDWERYHTPRNLAALISSEAGELLALFRWDQDSLAERPMKVRHELAEVFLGILRGPAALRPWQGSPPCPPHDVDPDTEESHGFRLPISRPEPDA